MLTWPLRGMRSANREPPLSMRLRTQLLREKKLSAGGRKPKAGRHEQSERLRTQLPREMKLIPAGLRSSGRRRQRPAAWRKPCRSWGPRSGTRLQRWRKLSRSWPEFKSRVPPLWKLRGSYSRKWTGRLRKHSWKGGRRLRKQTSGRKTCKKWFGWRGWKAARQRRRRRCGKRPCARRSSSRKSCGKLCGSCGRRERRVRRMLCGRRRPWLWPSRSWRRPGKLWRSCGVTSSGFGRTPLLLVPLLPMQTPAPHSTRLKRLRHRQTRVVRLQI
eukprot:jgi/Botrbrau1/13085/Bobra.0187s0045.1